jgi:hypothetical protein
MRRRLLFLGPLAVLGFLLFIALGGAIVQLLWNWLLPPLFGWPQVGFWQALGILALCRILFGGLGTHDSARSNIRGRMAQRWGRMTPEERERLRQGMCERFGFGAASGESNQE